MGRVASGTGLPGVWGPAGASEEPWGEGEGTCLEGKRTPHPDVPSTSLPGLKLGQERVSRGPAQAGSVWAEKVLFSLRPYRVFAAVMSRAGYPGLPAWPHSFYSLNLL